MTPSDLTFTLRPAGPEDALNIARLHTVGWDTTNPAVLPIEVLENQPLEERRAGWLQWITDGRGILLLTVDQYDRPSGFICLRPDLHPEDTGHFDAEVTHHYVAPERQAMGLGRRLLTAGARVARERGWHRLAVRVFRGNPNAGFYLHCGARLVAERTIDVDGVPVEEIAYGWADTADLLTG